MNRACASVIMPCYNCAAYVAEAIQSALDQVYRPVEVVVVDDGSTDDSLAIIRSFGGAVRVLTGGRCGAAAARNRALQVCAGEYIQFLDADDRLHPDKIRVCVFTPC